MTLTHPRSGLAGALKRFDVRAQIVFSLCSCLVFKHKSPEVSWKMKVSSSLKKKGCMCLADRSQFSVLCTLGFLKCTINLVGPALMFYSVSCGPSEARCIIRDCLQKRLARNDAIPRKRTLSCFFKSAVSNLICTDLIPNDPVLTFICFLSLGQTGSEEAIRWEMLHLCELQPSSVGSGWAGGNQGWFLHSWTY